MNGLSEPFILYLNGIVKEREQGIVGVLQLCFYALPEAGVFIKSLLFKPGVGLVIPYA
jgi:hypothetical protein